MRNYGNEIGTVPDVSGFSGGGNVVSGRAVLRTQNVDLRVQYELVCDLCETHQRNYEEYQCASLHETEEV